MFAGATQNILSSDLQKKLADGVSVKITAKIDGTCCWIHEGSLLARQDVKTGRQRPQGWIPTAGEEPDAGGHLIGFRPLTDGDKWHKKALLGDGNALFIEMDTQGSLHYVERPLCDFEGMTVELIGPKMNGNKHGVDKMALVVHGSIDISASVGDTWKTHGGLVAWLGGTEGSKYEGIVLHLGDGSLFKCHRGHLGGQWNGSMWVVTEV